MVASFGSGGSACAPGTKQVVAVSPPRRSPWYSGTPSHAKKNGLTRGNVTVARTGIEPVTFHFSGERYYHLSYLAERSAFASSDPDGTRTRDLRRDRAAR
jgi:hypothetical protein